MAPLDIPLSAMPVTRADARAQGVPLYFLNKPCPKGHNVARWAINSTCGLCGRAQSDKWAANNPAKAAEIKRKHADKSEAKEVNRVASARVRKRNPNKAAAWKIANPERKRELNRLSSKRHPESGAREQANRRARKANATPKWADLDAIAAIYAHSAALTKITGIEHHVDHIIPLRGRTVCGLHVESNLRVITARENYDKGNKLVGLAA